MIPGDFYDLVILRFKYFLHKALFVLDQQTIALNSLKMNRRRLAEVTECSKAPCPPRPFEGLSHSPAHSKLAGNLATPHWYVQQKRGYISPEIPFWNLLGIISLL